jgi:hypothetical protein
MQLAGVSKSVSSTDVARALRAQTKIKKVEGNDVMVEKSWFVIDFGTDAQFPPAQTVSDQVPLWAALVDYLL